MLVSEAEATNTTLFLALSSDLNITPAGRSFVQEQDVYLSCDTNYGSALLVYTLDGTQPGFDAPDVRVHVAEVLAHRGTVPRPT